MAFSPDLVKTVNMSILCYFLSMWVSRQAHTIAPQAGLGEHLVAHVMLN